MDDPAQAGSLRDMLGRKKPAGASTTSASPFAAGALGARGEAHTLAAATQADQPALTASRHTPPARGSVSIGFKVEKTKEDLRKAAMSKDLHAMKAALAAVSALAAIADVDFTTEEALVREAILAQGTHAIERMNIHDSSAIDEVVHKFWELMQRESIKADPDTPPDTVTRAGYEAVYIRINKCVWTQTEDGEMWDIAAAKAEGQIDWELDISRFKENATIDNWLRRIRCAMVAFKM
jgi:hypothetical protein